MRRTAHRAVARRMTIPKRLQVKRGMSSRGLARESRRLIRRQVRATGIPTRYIHSSLR